VLSDRIAAAAGFARFWADACQCDRAYDVVQNPFFEKPIKFERLSSSEFLFVWGNDSKTLLSEIYLRKYYLKPSPLSTPALRQHEIAALTYHFAGALEALSDHLQEVR
jgi:hypothetical protein